MVYYTKDEIILMDKYGQISGPIIDDAFEALNGLSELVGNELIETYISQELGPELAKTLGKDRQYTGLYGSSNGGIAQLIEYWKDWMLIREIENSDRILEKLKKNFRFDNVDFELYIMANVIRSGGIIEILREGIDRIPDFRFKFDNSEEWTYGEVTRRGKSTWKYAEKRADELVEILKWDIIGKQATLAIKEILGNDQFERLKKWLKGGPENMSEFEGVALYYTNNHGVDDIEVSLKYIASPFFCTGGHLFDNDNFIRIHAPYLDGGMHGILENKCSQISNANKSLLFIDVTQSIWTGWKNIIEEEFIDQKYNHISTIILLRQGRNIQTEILVISNINSTNPIPDTVLEIISQPYKVL